MDSRYHDYRKIGDHVSVIDTTLRGRIVGTATVFDAYGAHMLYVVYLNVGFYAENRTTYVSMMLCENSNLIPVEEAQ